MIWGLILILVPHLSKTDYRYTPTQQSDIACRSSCFTILLSSHILVVCKPFNQPRKQHRRLTKAPFSLCAANHIPNTAKSPPSMQTGSKKTGGGNVTFRACLARAMTSQKPVLSQIRQPNQQAIHLWDVTIA
ncbi:hypothetical protein CDAR_105141 [Caerostris darwini]|uniref:Uncharacterized protein n=1 Tax=Caerostris darwini TaxID=1538125 RepID=A0AAV4V5X6_9ARAC|nr:hypothetical protein CDAR_105141 [Caerostris darwini]